MIKACTMPMPKAISRLRRNSPCWIAYHDFFPQTTFDIHSEGQQFHRSSKPTNELRARNRTVYRADLRKQLLGQEKQRRQSVSSTGDLMEHEERQENIATELLSMTRSLKESMTLAGNVLKDDNKLLSSMHTQVDSNLERLNTEGSRLSRHAYKCGFDCALVFVALFHFLVIHLYGHHHENVPQESR
ncbi:Membrane fusion protein Use1 [Parelaphostrongylus tenuis]|uniref:Vesicle transport protein USE1 n=1 Tax=Parelaphostrongylus tenuis TaxID=148309 RepID=A0AAD5MNK0_PARTN|nr:Membrane fusion protein Use1 [Parelaphostrongylus tenuis]